MSPARRKSRRAPRTQRLENVAVLGLGKAGGSLVASLEQAGVHVVARARRLDRLLATRGLPDAQVLFLAVPDRVLDDVARALAARWPATGGPSLVAHLAGSRGLDALEPLAAHARVASFHPLASLDGTHPVPEGTLVAWDASHAADGRLLAALARRCGLTPARVRDDARVHYHAAAVIAGNLPVALLASAVGLLIDAGVPAVTARRSLARLLGSQAKNAAEHPLASALTGPVARGDAATLGRHLEVLDDEAAALAQVYRALSRVLIEDVSRHPPHVRAALHAALRP